MTHFIDVHSNLPYTRVIHTYVCTIVIQIRTCMHTYYYTMESIRIFISLDLVMLTVTLSNKFTVSYGDIQIIICILTL